jgi:hypothetical protein
LPTPPVGPSERGHHARLDPSRPRPRCRLRHVGLGTIAARNLEDAIRQLLDSLEDQARQTRERLAGTSVPSIDLDLDRITAAVDTINERVELRTQELEDRIADLEARLDTVLDRVEDGLPDSAAEVMAQARGAAKDARSQLRTLVGRAA